MKNILKENAELKLFGRLLFAVSFVRDKDVKNKCMLDIGCGYGWCELNFIGRGATKVTGTELTKKDLKAALRSVKDPRVSFVVASALQLPFGDKSFDTVVSWEVLEHIPKHTEDIMFKEASRVLKDGGVFYLSTPFKSFFSNTLDPAWWLAGHRHYPKRKIEKLARDNSFKIIDVTVRGGIWTSFSSINMYVSKWFLGRNRLYESFFQDKEDKEFRGRKGFNNIFVKLEKIPR